MNSNEKRTKCIKFKKYDFQMNEEYGGVIIRTETTDARLRVYVEMDDFPGEPLFKSFRYSENLDSELFRFMEDMQIVKKNRLVVLDNLTDIRVIVTLNQGNDNNWYIREIYRDEESEYDDEEFDGLESDEDDEDLEFD